MLSGVIVSSFSMSCTADSTVVILIDFKESLIVHGERQEMVGISERTLQGQVSFLKFPYAHLKPFCLSISGSNGSLAPFLSTTLTKVIKMLHFNSAYSTISTWALLVCAYNAYYLAWKLSHQGSVDEIRILMLTHSIFFRCKRYLRLLRWWKPETKTLLFLI